MGRRVAMFNWAETSVGSILRWPSSLKSTVKTLLASRYPMILLWGPDLIQIYNDAYIGLIGAKHPDALGRSIRETQSESWDAIGPMIHSVIATGNPIWVPAQLLPLERSGYLEESYFSLSYSAVDDDSGAIRGMLCVCSEVTEQVVSERRLKLLRAIAARANEVQGVAEVCDAIARILDEARADVPFAAIYLRGASGKKLTLQAVAGSDAARSLFPAEAGFEDGAGSAGPFAEAARGKIVDSTLDSGLFGKTRVEDVKGGAFESPVRSVRLLPISVSGEQGAPDGVLVAAVGPNRALDDDYRSFYELLATQVCGAIGNARAYEDAKRRAEALAELDREKTAFFSNVSHEFRTPLTLMLGPLEDLLGSDRGARIDVRRETLEGVYRNSLRLLKLVNTLLDFSRAEAGRLQASFEPVPLAAVTRELASHFESAAARAGITLEIDTPDLPRDVVVDRDLWEKIVLNLLSNAFKFTFEGRVAVALRDLGNEAELSVSDTGTGIPSAELPKIFDRFHRVSGARSRSHEGSGIGLSLVRELSRLHGGEASVESEFGKGSAFRVRIPYRGPGAEGVRTGSGPRDTKPSCACVQAFVDETAIGDLEETDVARGAPVSGRERVLVVDDNSGMRSYVSGLLSPHYDVVIARNGREALAEIDRWRPMLILSDVMMPELDGFGLLAQIRSREETKRIPFILLSARAGDEATVEGLDAGADDYLPKPFSAKELLARVRTQISMAALRRDLELEKKAIAIRDEFLSIASHELKTPLTSLRLQSDVRARMLAKAAGVPWNREQLVRMVDADTRQLKRISHLVDDMLDISRMDAGRLSLEKETFDLGALVREVVERETTDLPSGGVGPVLGRVDSSRGAWDRFRLEQVLVNLLGNALKYAGGTRIEVTLEDAGDRAILRVRDEGEGIAPVDHERIFERFVRAPSPAAIPGLGIGLYIVREIVEMHQGRVWVESALGRGATFVVELPKG